VRDRMRSVAHHLIEIGRASRGRSGDFREKQKTAYRRLMSVTRMVVAQAWTVADEVRRGIKKTADWQGQLIVDLLARELKDVSALTSQVLEQAKAQAAGVKKVAIPNKQTRSPGRWAYQRQRWRVGCEGRINIAQATTKGRQKPKSAGNTSRLVSGAACSGKMTFTPESS
jgi:hypothetical protein